MDKRVENKIKLIERFPNAIIFIPNSPGSAELVSQLVIADSIDAMVRMKVGSEIDIKDFSEHLEKLNELKEKITEVNNELIEKIAKIDSFFNNKGKMRPGLIANKGARKAIEAKRKELMPQKQENETEIA